MAETKEKLIRVLQIIQDTNESCPINANELITRLEREYDIAGVDRHSVYQDMAVLEKCGYPIKQCADKRKGWYFDENGLKDWELCILIDAVMQSKCLALEEAERIRNILIKMTSRRGRSCFERNIKADSYGQIEKGYSVRKNLEAMLEALYQNKKVLFQYTELDDSLHIRLRGEGRVYCLSLYAFYWSNNTYYLVGAHDNHEGLTRYRLDRIRNLNVSEEDTLPAEDKLGKNAVKIIQKEIMLGVNNYGGKEKKIVLEYEPGREANAILFDFAGAGMDVVRMNSGRLRVSFKKLDSVNLHSWLMQYSGIFQLIEPVEIRDSIIERLESGMKTYRKKATKKILSDLD